MIELLVSRIKTKAKPFKSTLLLSHRYVKGVELTVKHQGLPMGKL
jgi:hypothetical protein